MPGITFHIFPCGRVSGYLCKEVRGEFTHAEIMIDTDAKQLKIRPNFGAGKKLSGGNKDSSTRGCISVTMFLCRQVMAANEVKGFVALHPEENGWWVGSYARGEE